MCPTYIQGDQHGHKQDQGGNNYSPHDNSDFGVVILHHTDSNSKLSVICNNLTATNHSTTTTGLRAMSIFRDYNITIWANPMCQDYLT